MTGNEFFGFPEKRRQPPPVDPAENAPFFIDHAAWAKAGDWGGQPFKTIPCGQHEAIAAKVWWRNPSSGGVPVLCFRWVVPDGPHRGASLIESLPLNAENPKAKSIAITRLREIVTAAGMSAVPRQPSDMHGITVVLLVTERQHFAKPGQMMPWVEKHLPAPEVG